MRCDEIITVYVVVSFNTNSGSLNFVFYQFVYRRLPSKVQCKNDVCHTSSS